MFEEVAKDDRRRPVPGPGHPLPGRDRVRRPAHHADHQEPPQRRRAARGHEARADRAAARAVQGRGPPASAIELGLPEDVGLAPARSPAPAWPSAPRRGHRRAARTCCGRPTRSCSRRSAGPGWTASCGRRSRCCLPVQTRRGHGRRPHLRQPDRPPGGDQPGRHDGRLSPASPRRCWSASRPGSSTRSAGSTGSSTTSPPSPRARSSGSEPVRVGLRPTTGRFRPAAAPVGYP